MNKHYKPKDIESKWQEIWARHGIYAFDRIGDRPVFSIDTPPPYVSAAHLHSGHAMSYIQAEIITRFRRMQGYNVFYPMGFDDNGLPTERYVEEKYKIDKSMISRKEFNELCLRETAIGAENYRKIWESLAIGVDWSLMYSTIGERAQKIAQRSFIDLFNKGLIYREDSPSFWCPNCVTALAQADLEDEEAEGTMFYITFVASSGEHLTVATTRPELLPACVALYVNPSDERYKHLVGKQAEVPLFGYEVSILTHADVMPDFGTGLMMVCSWGDADDVKKWKENKLDSRILIDKTGRLTEIAGKFSGLSIQEAREEIIHSLKEKEYIVREEPIVHTRNVHERCGTPVEFVSSPQWFIKMLEHRDEFLGRGEELEWFPFFMKERYKHWVQGLKWDWCISRDRYYGVPFPVWYCTNCGQVAFPEDKNLPVDPRDSCSEGLVCGNCDSKSFVPENQVMDTWMTSSLTPLINASWGDDDNLISKIYPMDLRVQAFEIIRTWLFYTIVKSQYHTETLPWKSVMISGWGLDKEGKKMSKSQGNFVAIEEVIDKYSADAIRWWSTGSGLGQNLRYTEEDIQNGQKIVTKLWNAARFVKMILDQFKDIELSNEKSSFSDRWITAELRGLINEHTEALEKCDYNKARILLEKFFWIKYCDNYLELCKDRSWYPEKYSQSQLSSLVTTLRFTLETLLKLFAPILPYVTEEIYHLLFNCEESQSIHLSVWPTAQLLPTDSDLRKLSPMLIDMIGRIRHFKTKVIQSYRAEISSLSLLTDNPLLQESVSDLAGIANAKEFFINQRVLDEIEHGIEYEICPGTTIIMKK